MTDDLEPDAASEDDVPLSGWTEEDAELDRLYRDALAVVDAIERDMRMPWTEDAPDIAENAEPPHGEASLPDQSAPVAGFCQDVAAATASAHAASDKESPAEEPPVEESPEEPADAGASILSLPTVGTADRPTAEQVLEAALFVGGGPLSTKRLVHLLRDEFPPEYVDDALDRLNRRYQDEGRPYEVRLIDGGWQLSLRSEHEKVRHRVYGMGPKEVKLSQEALEVLALVAYHQPVSDEEIVALGKASPVPLLRQLLRRELIALERGPNRKDVKYRTTSRFLELFDLRSLEDLPQAEEIAFK